MSQRTVLNELYKGLVENATIPAEVRKRDDGRLYASFGGAVPIHCCTPEEIERLSAQTHHYCDIFTEQTLAPLGELAYVRLDENTAEKVFINRSKRILIVSADGRLAQWRAAPTFESANQYMAGAPIVDKEGALVSLVTARRGNHYAVSNIEGDGGYFETPLPWKVLDPPAGHLMYGDRSFPSRDQLRQYVGALPPPTQGTSEGPSQAVLQRAAAPRVSLVAATGRQFAHVILQGVSTSGVEYL